MERPEGVRGTLGSRREWSCRAGAAACSALRLERKGRKVAGQGKRSKV